MISLIIRVMTVFRHCSIFCKVVSLFELALPLFRGFDFWYNLSGHEYHYSQIIQTRDLCNILIKVRVEQNTAPSVIVRHIYPYDSHSTEQRDILQRFETNENLG